MAYTVLLVQNIDRLTKSGRQFLNGHEICNITNDYCRDRYIKEIHSQTTDLYFSDVFVQKMHKIDESQTQTLKKNCLIYGSIGHFSLNYCIIRVSFM